MSADYLSENPRLSASSRAPPYDLAALALEAGYEALGRNVPLNIRTRNTPHSTRLILEREVDLQISMGGEVTRGCHLRSSTCPIAVGSRP